MLTLLEKTWARFMEELSDKKFDAEISFMLAKMSVLVEEGGNISTSFEKSDQIPKMLSQMMSTGEKTGKMEDVLTKLSNFYTREIDNLLKNIMSLIEPIVMILLGIAVLIMFAAILMPMYEMAMSV